MAPSSAGGAVGPFWAPWARPAARQRVRTPHAAFANGGGDDDDDVPAAAGKSGK
jgi:hypothetical protein